MASNTEPEDGAIQVAVRVRPFNDRELRNGAKCIIEMFEGTTVITDPTCFAEGEASDIWKTKFSFDHSFWSFDPNDEHFVDQACVFDTYGPWVVNNVMEGYNCCIFAYGQTGAGKSYTMMGQTTSNCNEDEADVLNLNKDDPGIGLIPRTCRSLFHRIESEIAIRKEAESLESTGSIYTDMIEASYFEIYNEEVYDLLSETSSKLPTSLRVREHPTTGSYVEDLLGISVTSYNQIEQLLVEGNKRRHVSGTFMNKNSSRSHAVFQLVFRQSSTSGKQRVEKTSKLFLVDLAGSERVATSGATGHRLNEAASINKSLSALAVVIRSLAEQDSNKASKGKQFVPYRNSKLTWLLKEALGGNSKTLMLANISPDAINYQESLCTLRYAKRAKKIVNKARVNQDSNEVLITSLRAEIEALKSKLENQTIDGPGCVADNQSEAQLQALQEKLLADEKLMSRLSQTWAEKESEAAQHFLVMKQKQDELENERQKYEAEVEKLRQEQIEQQLRGAEEERKRAERQQRHKLELEQQMRKRKLEQNKHQGLQRQMEVATSRIEELESQVLDMQEQRDLVDQTLQQQRRQFEQYKVKMERSALKDKALVKKKDAKSTALEKAHLQLMQKLEEIEKSHSSQLNSFMSQTWMALHAQEEDTSITETIPQTDVLLEELKCMVLEKERETRKASELESELEKKNGKIVEVETLVQHHAATISEIQTTCEQQDTRIKNLQATISSKEAELKNSIQKIENFVIENDNIQAASKQVEEQLKSQVKVLECTLAEKSSTCDIWIEKHSKTEENEKQLMNVAERLKLDLETCTNEKSQLEAKVQDLESNCDTNQVQVESMQERINTLKQSLTTAEESVSAHTQRFVNVEQSLSEKKQELAAALTNIQVVENEHQAKVKELELQISYWEKEVKSRDEELKSLSDAHTKELKDQEKTLHSERESFDASLKESHLKLDLSNAELTETKSQLQRSDGKINELNTTCASLVSELNDLKANMKLLTSQNHKLEESLNEAQSMELSIQSKCSKLESDLNSKISLLEQRDSEIRALQHGLQVLTEFSNQMTLKAKTAPCFLEPFETVSLNLNDIPVEILSNECKTPTNSENTMKLNKFEDVESLFDGTCSSQQQVCLRVNEVKKKITDSIQWKTDKVLEVVQGKLAKCKLTYTEELKDVEQTLSSCQAENVMLKNQVEKLSNELDETGNVKESKIITLEANIKEVSKKLQDTLATKQDLDSKLEELSQQLVERGDAQNMLQQQYELKVNEIVSLNTQLQASSSNLEELMTKLASKEERVQELQKQVEETKLFAQELQNGIDSSKTLNTELEHALGCANQDCDQLRSQLHEANALVESLRSKHLLLEQDIHAKLECHKTVDEQLHETTKSLNTTIDENQRLVEEVSTLASKLGDVQQQLVTSKHVVEESQSKCSKILLENESLQLQLENHKEESNELRSKLLSTETKVETLSEQCSSLQSQVNALDININGKDIRIDELTRTISELEKNVAESEAKTRTIKDFESVESQLVSKITNLESSLSQSEEKCKVLEREKCEALEQVKAEAEYKTSFALQLKHSQAALQTNRDEFEKLQVEFSNARVAREERDETSQQEIDQIHLSLQQERVKCGILQDVKEKQDTDIIELRNQLSATETQLKQVTKDKEAEHKSMLKANQQVVELNETVNSLKLQLGNLSTKVSELEDTEFRLSETLREAIAAKDALEGGEEIKTKEVQESLIETRNALLLKETEFAELLGKHTASSNELQAVKKQFEDVTQKLLHKDSTIEKLTRHSEKLIAEMDNLRIAELDSSKRVTSLETNIESLESDIVFERSKLMRLKSSSEGQTEELSSAKAELATKSARLTKVSLELSEHQEVVSILRHEVEELKQANQTIRDQFTESFVLRERELVESNAVLKETVSRRESAIMILQERIGELEDERAHERQALDRILEAQRSEGSQSYTTFS